MDFSFNDGRDWFFKERFGMFIHWGIYSVSQWHEQYQWRMRIPSAEYVKLADAFNPTEFQPEKWLDLCEDAGVSYICFTTKHHDGFCMWDTKCTDFKITCTKYGKDILAQLAEACHRRNIRLGLYYSCPDWHHPNSLNFGGNHQLPTPNPGDQPDLLKYVQFVKAQITELCTNYGEISEFFWDIPPLVNFPELNATIRRLQPNCLINDRGYGPGDYSTPERSLPAGMPFNKPTEACDSVGRCAWGYRRNEDYYTPVALMKRIDKILTKGGNYLLNIGPKPDGTLPEEAVETFKAIGKWYKAVAESFDAKPFLLDPSLGNPISDVNGAYTLMQNSSGDIYVHFANDLESTGFELPTERLPRKVTLMNTGEEIPFEVDFMPSHAMIGQKDLHVFGIHSDRLLDTVPVFKIVF